MSERRYTIEQIRGAYMAGKLGRPLAVAAKPEQPIEETFAFRRLWQLIGMHGSRAFSGENPHHWKARAVFVNEIATGRHGRLDAVFDLIANLAEPVYGKSAASYIKDCLSRRLSELEDDWHRLHPGQEIPPSPEAVAAAWGDLWPR